MWEGQLEDKEVPHPDGNLFDPVAGDPGVDGRFTGRVKPTMTEFWTSRQRDIFLGTVATAIAGATLAAAAAPMLAGAALLGAMDRARQARTRPLRIFPSVER